MELLSEQLLIRRLNKLALKSTKRIWIASPYIGDFKSTRRILGNKCFTPNDINVRLLTDINEIGKLSADTLDGFMKSGVIKSLRGLHAKIYIFDNDVIVTSANLTNTAFSARFEMGVWIVGNLAIDAIAQYEKWWEASFIVTPNELEDIKNRISHTPSSNDGKGLTKRWKLPNDPKQSKKTARQNLTGFEFFVQSYKELSAEYSNIQRLKPDIPLFLEIDAFLNYLFHVGERPSNQFKRQLGKSFRKLNAKQRNNELAKYALKFKLWVQQGNLKELINRHNSAKLIHKTLKKSSIQSLTASKVKNVVDQLHCMNSYAINKTRFMNPKNNELQVIQYYWSQLLHTKSDIKIRMAEAKIALRFFGDSSVQELIGFYDPGQYPIRNGNSSAGLRFFGYDV